MPDAGTLEQYLKGEPLNEELAALKKGEEPLDADSRTSVSAPSPFDARPLDNDDREHLRRWRYEAGWPLMLRLLDNDTQRLENLAKAASLDNPLGNREEIAAQWAYVAMLRRVRERLVWLVDQEIEKAV